MENDEKIFVRIPCEYRGKDISKRRIKVTYNDGKTEELFCENCGTGRYIDRCEMICGFEGVRDWEAVGRVMERIEMEFRKEHLPFICAKCERQYNGTGRHKDEWIRYDILMD